MPYEVPFEVAFEWRKKMTKAVMHLDSQCKVDSCLRCIEFPFKIIGDAIGRDMECLKMDHG